MTTPHWPLTGLRLTTPRLELRWPTAADLEALAAWPPRACIIRRAAVHHPLDRRQSIRASAGHPAVSLAAMGGLEPANWSLNLVVARDGAVVASQGMGARDYAVLREVSTGSWVGQRYHRRGIGTEMRAAVLHLAFAGLGAEYATSSAFDDNAASLAVSRKLGYADDGIERLVVRGRPVVARAAAPRPGRLGGPPGHPGRDKRPAALPGLLWINAVIGAGRPGPAGPAPAGCRPGPVRYRLRIPISRPAGASARPASAQASPKRSARNPTASGPAPPASPAALLSVTATPLRPGRLPYRLACSTGYQGAVAMLSAARIASLGQNPGTSRKPGYSTAAAAALAVRTRSPAVRSSTRTRAMSPASPATSRTPTPSAASAGVAWTTSTR